MQVNCNSSQTGVLPFQRERRVNLEKIGFIATFALSVTASTWVMLREPNLTSLDWNLAKATALVTAIILVGAKITECATRRPL